jgi:predicted peptidase
MKYLFLLLLTSTALAQSAGYQADIFITEEGKRLPYRILFPPEEVAGEKPALILFLHGAGERGTDNEKQLTHGSKLFLDNQARYPAIVVLPQCPPENYWAAVDIDRSKQPIGLTFREGKPNWPLQAALDLVDRLVKEHNVDKKRVYIIGLSMGGMGTLEALSREPKRFAAAVPICAASDLDRAKRFARRVPIWLFHGEKDNVVDVKFSRDLHQRLQALRAEVRYTEYPNVNHNSWDNAFAEPELLPWLFSKKR